MKWSDSGESQDIEDRRDESGGGGGFQFGGMHIGIGSAIILLILSFVFKTNLFTLLSSGGAGNPGPAEVRQPEVRATLQSTPWSHSVWQRLTATLPFRVLQSADT